MTLTVDNDGMSEEKAPETDRERLLAFSERLVDLESMIHAVEIPLVDAGYLDGMDTIDATKGAYAEARAQVPQSGIRVGDRLSFRGMQKAVEYLEALSEDREFSNILGSSDEFIRKKAQSRAVSRASVRATSPGTPPKSPMKKTTVVSFDPSTVAVHTNTNKSFWTDDPRVPRAMTFEDYRAMQSLTSRVGLVQDEHTMNWCVAVCDAIGL